MLTSVPRQRPSFLSALLNFVTAHPTTNFARSREQAAHRRAEELLDRMPPELLDDIGLLHDADVCLTDRGLVEAARRLRKGWS
jgi:uncharacterized protein YjiS (DUF1127 family)